ncbi:MAG: protein kinase [Lachnospiraceae bacterium]|nr:protein kinase [Lachnospiraceae bacterium]
MRYCPYCMQPADEGNFCPHCGGDLNWEAGDTQLPVGTELVGTLHTYRIGAARGQGGFGVTYAALEQERKIKVAIKEYFPMSYAFRNPDHIVSPKPGSENGFRVGYDNFCKEARRLASVKPLPSVVRVWDCFQTNGTAYLVMDFLDGTPLHKKMKEMGGVIPAQDILPRLSPLIEDLSELHREGIIHRDISPDNILWMEDGTLKLIDFGSARSMDSDRSMTIFLKHGFAPVEQYRTRGQGTYTDVYALSATIYYVLTGQLPPSAVNRLENDTLAPPTSYGAALSPEEEQALIRGLEVQPKDRIQTMEEFQRELIRTPPVSPDTIRKQEIHADEPEQEETAVYYEEEKKRPTKNKNGRKLVLGLIAAAAVIVIVILLSRIL